MDVLLEMMESYGYIAMFFCMLLNKHKQITSTMVLGHTGLRTSHPNCPFMTSLPQHRDGMNEPTDTYVWGSIIDNELSPEEVLLWNIFPFHPHKNSPFTNRTPTEEELMDGLGYTRQLLQLCPTNITIGTVGKKAFTILNQAGFDVSLMRHPANGGAGKFRQQFTEWIGQNRHDRGLCSYSRQNRSKFRGRDVRRRCLCSGLGTSPMQSRLSTAQRFNR